MHTLACVVTVTGFPCSVGDAEERKAFKDHRHLKLRDIPKKGELDSEKGGESLPELENK